MPLETQIHTEQKEWERERGSECCDRSAVRSADSCPPFELSADLLPLPVELRDVLQLHARGARRLNRRLGGKGKKTPDMTGEMKPAFTFCYIDFCQHSRCKCSNMSADKKERLERTVTSDSYSLQSQCASQLKCKQHFYTPMQLSETELSL